jgi:uncharacterized membrane protein YraQ (UPF0718 family)
MVSSFRGIFMAPNRTNERKPAMQLPKLDVDVKLKMLVLKVTVGALTSLVIGMIVKEEIKVLDDAEEQMLEKKRQKTAQQQETES